MLDTDLDVYELAAKLPHVKLHIVYLGSENTESGLMLEVTCWRHYFILYNVYYTIYNV